MFHIDLYSTHHFRYFSSLLRMLIKLLQPPAFNLTDADQTCRDAIINSQVYAACGAVAGLTLDIEAKVEACVTDLQVMLKLSPLWPWQCQLLHLKLP